ncbi:MAG TPA: hypothetical protein VF591_16635 [Pyrinomonadaceae bacterium]|jgi:hypothetical protein
MILAALVVAGSALAACEHEKHGPINTNGKAGVAQGPANSDGAQPAQRAHATPEATPGREEEPDRDTPAGPGGIQAERGGVPLTSGGLLERVAGTWEMETANGVRWTLFVSGDEGKLRAEFAESGERVVVFQRIDVSETPQGLLLTGSDVTYVGSYTQKHNYSADRLLFQPQPGGEFRVLESDGVYSKEWRPVSVKSHLPE